MRVPLSWLRDYVDVDLAPEALAERLTLLGMEVKGIERWGADWRNVVVGELLSVEKHPRADRLSLTRVRVGDGEPLDIVCGATNIAAGQRVPVALPGAVLPGERRIERTEKMGVVSNGMLCSGDELNLTGDADGILILATDAPIGMALTELYGDVVLDVDVKPNRGDGLSLVGLAREVGAITGAPLRWPECDPAEDERDVANLLAVEVRDSDWCPRFVGRWVDGLTVGPSPDRVQMRLRAAGQRPISNVVDVSNYVMLELGKPIHAYDADHVAERDGRRQLVVRRAAAGERLETLDHVTRELDPDTLVIADDRAALGIAGIMGGADSEVADRTSRVIVESAIFDPIVIRRTGQRYGLRSEASLRFEKGQELRLARIGADRAARLVAEWAGGSVARGRVDSAAMEPEPARVAFRPARVNRLLGTTFSTAEQVALLARVGVATDAGSSDAGPTGGRARHDIVVAGAPKALAVDAGSDEVVVAIVPSWRRDIAIEADVSEEVARIGGYDAIPAILPHTPMPAWRPSPLELRDRVRETLAGAGLTETVSHALISPRLATTFTWAAELPPVAGGTPALGRTIHVTNPLSADHSVLRPALVGSLVEIVSTNLRRGREDVAIFEIGKGYGRDGDATREWWRLGLAMAGAFEEPSWNRPRREADLDDAKGVIELVCHRLGFDAPVWTVLDGEPLLHPGRAARVSATRNGAIALGGVLGELHPAAADTVDLRGARLVVAELEIAGLAGGRPADVHVAAPPRHPAAQRDIAIVVSETVAAATIAAAIRDATGSQLVSVRLFDIYRGTPLGPGEKSLAWRLVFQADERTLTEPEIEASVGRITSAVARAGGRIRT
ncbi:MAG TPA: phenylalanine--tRNA ligase subunit beta [Candidatus Limnocylindrales bacterium]|nr:phenylalanine--tRNA ligase subunit beta [Candidatus Limnocylindrales bacterium]